MLEPVAIVADTLPDDTGFLRLDGSFGAQANLLAAVSSLRLDDSRLIASTNDKRLLMVEAAQTTDGLFGDASADVFPYSLRPNMDTAPLATLASGALWPVAGSIRIRHQGALPADIDFRAKVEFDQTPPMSPR